MLTTLRTGSLSLTSVEYKFNALGSLTIKLTSTQPHKIYGKAEITLANVKDINIYFQNRNLVENAFNSTFSFERTGENTLEFSTKIASGILNTESFVTLPNNGSAITATVVNSSISLSPGSYNFLLLDTNDSNFSTSKISIKQKNIGGSGVDGIESLFNEDGVGSFLSINNQDLKFNNSAEISIYEDDSGVTNIPILIS